MNSTKRPLIVGISGRLESTLGRVTVALAVAQRAGAQTQRITGAALNLPLNEPANPARSPAPPALIDALRRPDGIILATHSYHGSATALSVVAHDVELKTSNATVARETWSRDSANVTTIYGADRDSDLTKIYDFINS